MDVLTDLLQRSRARGAAFSQTTAHGDWGIRFPGGTALAVHALVHGEAYLWADDPHGALHLLGGDIVLVRESTPHHLAHRRDGDCAPMESLMRDGDGVSKAMTAGDPAQHQTARFFCGAYRFEGDLCDGLLRSLPDTLRVRPASGSTLRNTLDLMAGEMGRDAPGQQALLDRLLDVALVQILRQHFDGAATDAPGWFRASLDPRIGEALRALHSDPARPWTVAELADHALMSRSAFARRFTQLVGTTPLGYLNDWRMGLAREQLRDSDDRLAAIAGALGYASEFSFAAAFKRHHGTAPGRWRSQHARPPGSPRPA